MFNMQKMMQQAQQVQFKLQELQEKFKEIDVEGQSGDGLVKVLMSCQGFVKNIDINPAIIKADDKETLEDLIIVAINNANDAKEVRIRQETEDMMKDMGLPKDAKLPF